MILPKNVAMEENGRFKRNAGCGIHRAWGPISYEEWEGRDSGGDSQVPHWSDRGTVVPSISVRSRTVKPYRVYLKLI